MIFEFQESLLRVRVFFTVSGCQYEVLCSFACVFAIQRENAHRQFQHVDVQWLESFSEGSCLWQALTEELFFGYVLFAMPKDWKGLLDG